MYDYKNIKNIILKFNIMQIHIYIVNIFILIKSYWYLKIIFQFIDNLKIDFFQVLI